MRFPHRRGGVPVECIDYDYPSQRCMGCRQRLEKSLGAKEEVQVAAQPTWMDRYELVDRKGIVELWRLIQKAKLRERDARLHG